jgi:hypothetical protein
MMHPRPIPAQTAPARGSPRRAVAAVITAAAGTPTPSPLSVDGVEIVASLVLLADRRAGRRSRWLPWAALTIGTAASLAANIATADTGAISRIIAGWPALALLIAVKLLSGILEHRRVAGRPAASVPDPAADAARDGPATKPGRCPGNRWSPSCPRRAGMPTVPQLGTARPASPRQRALPSAMPARRTAQERGLPTSGRCGQRLSRERCPPSLLCCPQRALRATSWSGTAIRSPETLLPPTSARPATPSAAPASHCYFTHSEPSQQACPERGLVSGPNRHVAVPQEWHTDHRLESCTWTTST